MLIVATFAAIGMSTSPTDWREFRARLAGSSPGAKAGSSKNDAALKQQDERLWREYAQDAWAHPTSLIEPGTLLCALPIQGQLIQEMRYARTDHYWPTALRDLITAGGSHEFISKWLEISAEPDAAAMAFAWKSATTMCNRGLSKMSSGIPNAEERLLWKIQCAALDRRRRVCMVLGDEDGEDGDSFRCLVHTKQLGSSVTPDLARRLLMGQRDAWRADAADVALMLAAFGAEAAQPAGVYWGGAVADGDCGQLVHGRDDVALPGAVEVGDGSRMYHVAGSAGLLAAARAVVDGSAASMDFRLSIGTTVLSREAAQCEWAPVACSRLFALKPSAGLPKPLWHEVMEAAGGEYAEMSTLLLEEATSGKRNPNKPRGDSDI